MGITKNGILAGAFKKFSRVRVNVRIVMLKLDRAFFYSYYALRQNI